MTQTFDPYHKWLGIPPAEQPPNHYRLLGLTVFESNRAVIEEAMLRQIAYVRDFQIGEYANEATQLLNEIAAAKGRLCDAKKKAAYDSQLRAAQAAASRLPVAVATPIARSAPAADIDLAALMPLTPAAAAPRSPTRLGKRTPGALPRRPKAAFSGARWQLPTGIALGVVITLTALALRPQDAAEPPTASEETAGEETADSDADLVSEAPLAGSETPSPAPLTPEPGIAPLNAAAGPRVDDDAPQVLQCKTETLWLDNVARYEGDSFYVGFNADSHGQAAVGYELDQAPRVVLELQVTGPSQRRDGGSFAGFVIDYHTPAGYSHRAALSIGPSNEQWRAVAPRGWGKRASADRFVDLSQDFAFNERRYQEEYDGLKAAVDAGRMPSSELLRHWQVTGRYEGRHAVFGSTDRHELKLADWAPPDWDGKVWFSIIVVNSGAGAGLEGRLIEPAPPRAEKLPGEYRRLTGHSDSIAALAFLPNGRLLSGSFDTTWAIWDTQIGIGMQRFATPNGHESAVRAVAAAPSGSIAHPGAALISNVNRINHFDVSTGKLLHQLDGHTWGVLCLAISADGKRAISGGGDYSARFWNLENGKQIWERAFPEWVRSAALSHDGRLVVVGTHCKEGGLIHLFDTAGSEIKSLQADGGLIIGLSLSRDGKRCLSGQPLRLWDLESGAELWRPDNGWGRPVLSADGRYAASIRADEFVCLWDVDKRKKIAELEHEPRGSPKQFRHASGDLPAAFSPDGKLLASGADDGTIYLWNLPELVAKAAANP